MYSAGAVWDSERYSVRRCSTADPQEQSNEKVPFKYFLCTALVGVAGYSGFQTMLDYRLFIERFRIVRINVCEL